MDDHVSSSILHHFALHAGLEVGSVSRVLTVYDLTNRVNCFTNSVRYCYYRSKERPQRHI